MRIVRQSAPAAQDRAVVLCCDGKYLPYSLMVAGRVLAQPGARDFDLCIVATDPVALPETLADWPVRLIEADLADQFDGQDIHRRLPKASYLRLALPDLLPEYRRILYLDSDIWVEGGDFGRLLSVELGTRPLAAVRDYMLWRNPGLHHPDFVTAGLPAAPYFNSGVIVFDPAVWRARAVMARCVEIGLRYGTRLAWWDQSLLNVLLHGDWAELSPVWNWQLSAKRPFLEDLAAPNIVHFIGPQKPWQGSDAGLMPLRYRKAWAAFMAAHFPGQPLVDPVGRQRLRERSTAMLLWFRHATATPGILRYLDRFADDFDVKP